MRSGIELCRVAGAVKGGRQKGNALRSQKQMLLSDGGAAALPPLSHQVGGAADTTLLETSQSLGVQHLVAAGLTAAALDPAGMYSLNTSVEVGASSTLSLTI